MNQTIAHLNSLWGQLIVEELIRNGGDYFCISPGSRSTPLTVAVARNPRSRYVIAYDERGAAFHALGYARATGKPAVLICTSGTAVANYFPAVVEASVDHLPVIIISADRPPELRETGANQTIRQTHLFGDYLKWRFELPVPDEHISPRMVLTTIDQLCYQAQTCPPGPVHLNCPFREPFLPEDQKSVPLRHQDLEHWLTTNQSFTFYSTHQVTPGAKTMDRAAQLLAGSKNCLLVAGRLHNPTDADAVLQLSRDLGLPLFADITSGLRLSNQSDTIIHYFDQMLLSGKFHEKLLPDLVVQFGNQPVSKRWLQLLEKHPPENFIGVQRHPYRQDPAHRVTLRIESDIARFCKVLQTSMTGSPHPGDTYRNTLRSLSLKIGELLAEELHPDCPLSDIAVARQLTCIIPAEQALFLASSMPVREMDMVGCPGSNVSVAANRGASGIDGTVASAVGYAVGANAPVTLFIGDLALLHDLNSLTLLSALPVPVILVVINNHGGGIFSFLPIAGARDIFDTFFATPHRWNFSHIAEMFDLAYFFPGTTREFVHAYRQAQRQQGHTLIEVQTDRGETTKFHKQLQMRIRQLIDQFMNE